MTWFALYVPLLSSVASAQDDDTPVDPDATEAPVAASASGPQKGVNLRYRYMFIPSAILDNWYFDSDDPGAYPLDRPKISTHVMGLEFALEPSPESLLFYAEYWKINLDPGYWDDREDDQAIDHTDGDWLAPSGLGAVAVGFDFGYEAPITDQGKASWLGFRVGGGIGAAVVTGRIDQWHNGRNLSADPTNNCLPDARQLDRYEACDPDETLELASTLDQIRAQWGLTYPADEVSS